MGFEITAYEVSWGAAGLVFALGGAAALARAANEREASSPPAPPGVLLLVPVVAALLAFVGARAHAMASSPAGVWRALIDGDLVTQALAARQRIAGGLLLATAFLLWAAPRASARRLGGLRALDVLVPWAGLSIGVGRIGCFLAGCCFGVPTAVPWSVVYPRGKAAYWNHVAQSLVSETDATSLPVHPLSLYLGAAAIGSALLVRWIARVPARPGVPTVVFVVCMATARLLLEPLRETRFLDVVPAQQQIDLALLVLALGAGAWLRRSAGERPQPDAASARPSPPKGSGPSSPGTPAF